MNLSEILPVMQSVAREAGQLQLRFFRQTMAITEKGSTRNIVTEADLAVEKLVVERLRSLFPDFNVVGEENSYAATASPWRWLIDPIDGTTNYSKGLAHFALSLALARDGEVQLGVVYNPAAGEMFWATRGGGAFLNGDRISVSTVDSLQKALLATGFYYDRDEKVTRTLRQVRALFDQDIMGIRRYGSAALDLCFLACGRFDGYWEHTLNAWDFAAGWLIAVEAGAVVEAADGKTLCLAKSGIMAAAPGIHDALTTCLASVPLAGFGQSAKDNDQIGGFNHV